MEWERGQVIRSLAGHDKGDFQVILKVEAPYAVLVDGRRRSLEKPKRKKLLHIAPTKTVLEEESLVTDRRIRNALRPFREQND